MHAVNEAPEPHDDTNAVVDTATRAVDEDSFHAKSDDNVVDSGDGGEAGAGGDGCTLVDSAVAEVVGDGSSQSGGVSYLIDLLSSDVADGLVFRGTALGTAPSGPVYRGWDQRITPIWHVRSTQQASPWFSLTSSWLTALWFAVNGMDVGETRFVWVYSKCRLQLTSIWRDPTYYTTSWDDWRRVEFFSTRDSEVLTQVIPADSVKYIVTVKVTESLKAWADRQDRGSWSGITEFPPTN